MRQWYVLMERPVPGALTIGCGTTSGLLLGPAEGGGCWWCMPPKPPPPPPGMCCCGPGGFIADPKPVCARGGTRCPIMKIHFILTFSRLIRSAQINVIHVIDEKSCSQISMSPSYLKTDDVWLNGLHNIYYKLAYRITFHIYPNETYGTSRDHGSELQTWFSLKNSGQIDEENIFG